MFLKHFLRLTLLLSLSTLTLNSAADDDGTWTYTLSGDEATITGCVATCPTQLVIPSTVDGYSVTIIGNDAFASHQLTSVTIPGSVTTFQQGAFYNNQLASVTIPDGVTTIDQQVFRRNQLTSVTIPYGVTTIGLLAFSENQLASVAFEGNRPSVSGNAFVDNPDLYSITYCLRRMGWPGDPILNGLVDVTPMGIDCSVSNDSDGDGIPDTLDAFPNDPAASVDTDGDGMPDDWNPGYLAQDSTSQPPLELDYDDDNDQRLDFRDEDSLDPATGRLTLATALERVIDQRLRQCLSDATQGFQFADEATHLYCVGEPWGDGDLYSLKGIEGFSGLEGVEIQNANLDDVSPLKWLASLSDLTLDNGYYGEDLSPLGQIQTLNRLQLVSSTGDLTWLPSLTALTGFYFAALLPEGGEPSIDLTKISGLTNLVTLSIYHGYYTDIAPLGSLTNLTTLILGNAKNLEWDLLKALTNLERLEVFANYGYFDVSILAAFPKLTAARIGAGYPELLEDLYNLPIGLTEFGIYNANITDFGWVARLSNLKRLQLGVSEGLLIEDLSQLKSIDYLDELNLWYAQVTRLDGVFDDWANGTVIELTGNPLLCSEIDAARQNPNIEIRFSGDCLGSNPSIDNYRYDAPNRTHVAYHYALESNPTDFPYELNADSYSVSQWGGSTAMSFFVSVNGTPQYFDYPFDAAALNEAWQSGNGIARMSTNATGDLDNFKFLVEGGSKPAQVGVFTSFGLSANDVAQANRHLRVTRTAPGTGNYNTDPAKGDNCSASYLEGFSNQVTEEKQIGLYFSDLVEGGEVALFDDRAAMNKIFNCADSPTGVYDLEVVVLDGRGGKKRFDLTVEVLEAQTPGGKLEWFSETPTGDCDADGIPDAQDAFPCDPAYSADSDGDGMPDAWELRYDLNPNDPMDAFFDADQDGYLNWEEFLLGLDPSVSDSAALVIYTDRSATLIPGRTSAFTVRYTTTDANPNLSGMGVRVHFNAAYVSEVRLDNVFQTGLLAVGEVEADTFDLDGDIETDQFILVSWASFSEPTWPGELPVDLFDVVITTTEAIADLDVYPVRFSTSDASTGYNLSAPSVYNPVVLASLDIDGDGSAKALSDGLMVIRRMFGFSGMTLINGAVSAEAIYASPEAIAERIDAFSEGFDVDANGETKALSDGLMIIRRLFGFSGETLVGGAVAPDATRTDPKEIADYIDSLSP